MRTQEHAEHRWLKAPLYSPIWLCLRGAQYNAGCQCPLFQRAGGLWEIWCSSHYRDSIPPADSPLQEKSSTGNVYWFYDCFSLPGFHKAILMDQRTWPTSMSIVLLVRMDIYTQTPIFATCCHTVLTDIIILGYLWDVSVCPWSFLSWLRLITCPSDWVEAHDPPHLPLDYNVIGSLGSLTILSPAGPTGSGSFWVLESFPVVLNSWQRQACSKVTMIYLSIGTS